MMRPHYLYKMAIGRKSPLSTENEENIGLKWLKKYINVKFMT